MLPALVILPVLVLLFKVILRVSIVMSKTVNAELLINQLPLETAHFLKNIIDNRLDKANKMIAANLSRNKKIAKVIAPEESKRNPKLLYEGYKGFNFIFYQGKFYGLAQDEGAFDINKVKKKQYKRCFVGNAVDEVKQLIDKSIQ